MTAGIDANEMFGLAVALVRAQAAEAELMRRLEASARQVAPAQSRPADEDDEEEPERWDGLA